MEPGESARLAFVTGAGEEREAVRAIAEKFSSVDAVDRTFTEASDRYRGELQDLQLRPEDVLLFNRLAANIVFPNPNSRQPADSRAAALDRSILWSHGISGDLPILLARAAAGDERLIREILNCATTSVVAEDCDLTLCLWTSAALPHLIGGAEGEFQGGVLDKPGGIFVLSSTTAPDDDMATISAAARVVLLSGTDSLAVSLIGKTSLPPFQSYRCLKRARPTRTGRAPGDDLLFWNGLGGFSADGREYTITVNTVRRGPSYLRHLGATS